jgi:hypothetical protein
MMAGGESTSIALIPSTFLITACSTALTVWYHDNQQMQSVSIVVYMYAKRTQLEQWDEQGI